MVARGIHRASVRSRAPFVAINCAALPESLLESELFGHRRGSFTGAATDQIGLFESAAGGTVFLDEVGEMPATMQAKLLRVLQEGEITRIGDPRPRKIDVRVISATNRDLAAEVAARRFREDLFYRLSPFPIRLPPLRARRFDVPLLADHFLRAAATQHGKRLAGIAPEAMTALQEYAWPGNVRQLQNEMERAVALAREGETIAPHQLSSAIYRPVSGAAPADDGPADADRELRPARAAFEARHIARILREQEGNVTRAARVLGLSRTMLQKKMKEYDLR
jgi:transcriptional regulator with PAS, ATPase and Fis domain